MPGAVVVWRVALDAAAPPDDRAIAELSDHERARAARFATDELRNRWLRGHVALRRILAQELGVAPAAIEYGSGEHGKPFIARPERSGVEFSYSDSGDVALVAVSRAGPVGVDVEVDRPSNDLTAIADRAFTPEHARLVRESAAADRARVFLRIWTETESAGKLLGLGLPLGAAAWDASAIRTVPLDMGKGWAACVAVRSRDAAVTVHDWPEA